MLVVGGTYWERCEIPVWNTTQGSGMRAAGALRLADARLLTAVDDSLAPDAELVANAIGLERDLVERSGPVGFEYFTPLSTPRIVGTKTTTTQPLRGEDETALVFGMLEANERRIRARRLVFDPQRPGSGSALDAAGLECDELAVVLNTGEARAFGGSQDLDKAVASLFARTLADVVVVKSGAAGCRVFTRTAPGASRLISACPTASVWPLGSGDTFAAGFAHAWSQGADPVEAANVGSMSAAYWCSTRSPVVPREVLGGDATQAALLGLTPLQLDFGTFSTAGITPDADERPSQTDARPTVYLAGPFFNISERWLVDLVRKALLSQGVDVFSPFHDVGLGDESVALADIEGLRRCQSVLALLDGSDFGTVYETGWAERAAIPVVGYASRPDKEGAKMLTGLGGELHDDLSTAIYRAAWRALGAPALPRQKPTSTPTPVIESP